MKNRATSAHDPATMVVNKVDVNQLLLRWRMQNLPRRSAVSRDREDAIHNNIATAGRTNQPAALLSVEAQAVQLRRGALEFGRRKFMHFAPGVSAVRSFKDAAAGDGEAAVLADEKNIVDGMVNAEPRLNPTATSVFGAREKATVSADPAAFRIDEINGIQVLTRGAN